ncbi:MAG: peptidoglycan endopeptidase [Ruminococcaceae bacterium]|nr:peptidoglycan endopeptidase [Oscillospiraceae bacterium]
MPEIKTRPGMNAPKARQADTAPKEAANILKRQYAEKQAERQPQPKNPVQYATDKVEKNERRAAALAADGTRRAVRQAKQRRERGKSATDTEPKKENAQPASEWEPLPAEPQPASEREPLPAEPQPDAAPPQPKQRPTAAPRPREQAPEPRPQQAMPKTRRSVEARQGADTPAAGQRRALQQRAKTRSGSAPQAEPAQSTAQPMSAAPKVPQLRPEPVMPKARPSADARVDADPEAPPLQEMRRQKVVQDTVRARQEARRSAEAEAVRANGPVKAEQGALHSVPERPTPKPNRNSSSITHHQADRTTGRRITKAGKGTPARLAGDHAPAKPSFTLKERSAIGRQAGKTLTPAARAKRMSEQKLREQVVRKNAETAQAVVHAVKAAVSSVAARGGGAVLLVVLIVVALIAAIVASPFGIFFSGESASADTVPISAAVAQVNFDFNARLEELQSADTYDDITVDGSTADWAEILAVFAAKVASSDGADATDVATIDADRIDRLKAVFWDMNAITSEVEIIDHPDSDPDDDADDSWTVKTLHITLTPKAAADMPSAYGFTARQTDAMNELLAERAMLEKLVGSLTAVCADAAELMKRFPADLSPERREVVRVACSLVGKVNYFWGGKSLVLGWDSRWGTIQKVWAEGNSTSGTYRPYGLDCSGFVDWVFYNVSGGAYVIGHGGGATMQHTYCTPISWADAIPGDLVFYPADMHVGIVGGRDADGNLLIIHCASSANCVVITNASGFTSVGRPTYYISS